MNYIEAKQFIESTKKYGSVLGLESIKTLLNEMGNPQNNLNIVHIAGTNGKGSTMAFLSSILMTAGYKVGRYSSPAVFEDDEIIQINNQNIEKLQLADIISKIKEKCQNIFETKGFHPTSFEIETALAFEYFSRNNCQIVLVECGMGGESDATNVFEKNLCSIISDISLDHTAFLGDTIEQIAIVKSGIIKKKCPVVIASQSKEATDVIINKANQKNSPYICAKVADLSFDGNKNNVKYKATNQKEYNATINMLGTYQKNNVAAAIEAALTLDGKTITTKATTVLNGEINESDFGLDGIMVTTKPQKLTLNIEPFIEEGISKAQWKGRMEIISKRPLFIIDGAHNPGAVSQLSDSIDLYFTNKRITFIMGVLADKDFEEESRIISKKATNIITVTPNNKRALSGEKLAETVLKYNKNVQYIEQIYKAVEIAFNQVQSGDSDMILAFGSLSHLKDIKQAVIAQKERTIDV